MLLRFNKSTGIILFTIGLICSLLFKQYIYGFLLTVFSFVVGLQYTLLQSSEPTILRYINWTALPGYIMLGFVSLVSLYINYKSTAITTIERGSAIVPFVLSCAITLLILQFSDRYELFQRDFFKMIPMFLFFVFIITTAIVPDNQAILRRTYAEATTDETKNEPTKPLVDPTSIA